MGLSGRAYAWTDEKGDHFIVYYQVNENFAHETLRNAETYYNRIAADLGYARYSNFWQWDNRVKIYIYPTLEEFQKATGQPAWSNGMAAYSKKEIHSFNASEGFMDGLLPHEITHLIFRDFVGIKGQIPLWLDEGVAQWEEPAKREMDKRYARYLVKVDKEFPLYDLTYKGINDASTEEQVQAFYLQSLSLVDFLVKTYGASSFTEFCRQLRDGKPFDDALRSAYPNFIQDMNDLEIKWRKYVMED